MINKISYENELDKLKETYLDLLYQEIMQRIKLREIIDSRKAVHQRFWRKYEEYEKMRGVKPKITLDAINTLIDDKLKKLK